MSERFANAYSTTLSAGIDNDDTSVTVATAPPTELQGGDWRALISPEGANTAEIITVTGVSGSTLTFVRATEPYAGSQTASSHASGATITHVLTAGAIRTTGLAFVGCAVYRSSNQTGLSGETTILWNAERFDTDGFHDTGSNTGRITIPSGMGGKYLITYSLDTMTNSGAGSYGELRINGSTYIPESTTYIDASTTHSSLNNSIVWDFISGDYVELRVSLAGGDTVTTSSGIQIYKLDSGKLGNAIGARAYNSTTQSLTNNTETVLTLDSEEFDTDNFHSTSSNTGRMTIPSGMSGKYIVKGSTYASFSGGTSRYLFIRVNGTNTYRTENSSTAPPATLEVVRVLSLNSGDYVELVGYQDSGSSQNFGHASAAYVQTSLEIARLDSGSPGASTTSASYKRTSGNYTTTSTTFVDVDSTNMSFTITTGARRVLMGFVGAAQLAGGGDNIYMDVTVDGTRQGGNAGLTGIRADNGGYRKNLAFTYLTDVLSAGPHTFKVQWRTRAGDTATLFGAGTAGADDHACQFYVQELF